MAISAPDVQRMISAMDYVIESIDKNLSRLKETRLCLVNGKELNEEQQQFLERMVK